MPVPLADLMDSLPRSYRTETILDTENSEIAVLRKLLEAEQATVRSGVHLAKDAGIVSLCRAGRNRLRILAESGKAEIASELCDAYFRKLKAYDSQLRQQPLSAFPDAGPAVRPAGSPPRS